MQAVAYIRAQSIGPAYGVILLALTRSNTLGLLRCLYLSHDGLLCEFGLSWYPVRTQDVVGFASGATRRTLISAISFARHSAVLPWRGIYRATSIDQMIVILHEKKFRWRLKSRMKLNQFDGQLFLSRRCRTTGSPQRHHSAAESAESFASSGP